MLCLTAPEGRAAPRVARAANTALAAAPSYARHVPERTLLYALVGVSTEFGPYRAVSTFV